RHIPQNVFRQEILECDQVVPPGRSRTVREKIQRDAEPTPAILSETVALARDVAFAASATQKSRCNLNTARRRRKRDFAIRPFRNGGLAAFAKAMACHGDGRSLGLPATIRSRIQRRIV